jgi:cell division protein FtsQ
VSMRPRTRRFLALAAIAVVGGGAYLGGPSALRHVGFFDADRVEVAGTRLLAPHEVLAASGIRMGASVWTDPAAWEAALRRHPVIADAKVSRRFPATLRIRVTEKRPAALVQAGVLRPVTAEGEVLPVDPSRTTVDLPLLRARMKAGDATRIEDAATRASLAEAGRLAELDPALMARVSEVRPGAKGETRLVLTAPRAEVIVPAAAGEPCLARVRAALADVARREAADTTGRTRALLDARYDDQVVVRIQI